MRFAILGSGGVGGYFGAKLARAGHDVTFLARGAHLRAMREHGLTIRGPDGDFTLPVKADDDVQRFGPVDAVLLAVKNYDVAAVLPAVKTLLDARGPLAPGEAPPFVLTLQNGVDSPSQVAAAVGEAAVLGGTTYISAAISEPGVITQTGTNHRIVLGEVFGDTSRVSARAQALRDALASSGVTVEAVADARGALWDKLSFLGCMSAFATASRLPVGALRDSPAFREMFRQATQEVLSVAAAEGVTTTRTPDSLVQYMDALPAHMRPSMLGDLENGKPLEVEYLQGAVVRRGRALGVPTPVLSTLYVLLMPHAQGERKA